MVTTEIGDGGNDDGDDDDEDNDDSEDQFCEFPASVGWKIRAKPVPALPSNNQ